MILDNIKNCIRKHFYHDKIENIQPNIHVNQTCSSNKRKITSDLKEIKVKKPVVLMSQINGLSTELKSEDHQHITVELKLEESGPEESSTSKENKNDKIMCLEKNELEKTNDVSEYCAKQIHIGQTVQYNYNIKQSDNANVTNINAQNISVSQCSKGDVVINRKLLEVFLESSFYFIKIYLSHNNLKRRKTFLVIFIN